MKLKLFFIFSTIFISSCITFKKGEPRTLSKLILPTSYDDGYCENPPEGMVCIPGGNFKSERLDNAEKVDTFYIDKYEITNADYTKCVEEKGCPANKSIKSKEFENLNGDNQPAVPLSFEMAYSYCKWNGKRLPTELEWEKTFNYNYSKSNPQINCSSANINGCNGKTLEVGKGIPTDQIFNMAGNVPEWTNDWVGECGKNCEGPQCLNVCLKNVSVCSGKFPCGKLNQKVVKGGGYNLPGENSNISSRMILDISGEKKHIGARCVSDTPYLTNAPAWIIKKPLPEPQSLDLPQVTDNERKILHELKEYDKLDKPFCDKPYTSPANCRDPVSYVKPNEARNYLFADYVKNLRGGYVGVAADANYSYIAQARSEWVWLMDFDFVIFNLHRIIKVFVLESETPGEFIEKFNPKNKPSSMALIEKVYRDHPDFSIMKTKVMDRYGASLYEHYKSISKPSKENGEFGWLRNPKAYSYIRMLHRKGRISIHGGDLLKDKTLFSIGESAKKLGVKIRIFYPSNAEEFWAFNENFKRNVLNLPFDEASVVLRTVHEYPWHVNDRKGGHAGFWHYVVHGAYNYQKKLQLPNYSGIQDFKNERIIPTDMRDFSTIHLPGNIPEGIKGN